MVTCNLDGLCDAQGPNVKHPFINASQKQKK